MSYRLVSLTSILGKVMEKILLKTTSTQKEDKVTEESAGVHEKEISPDQPDSFPDKMTSLVDKANTVAIIYLEFRNAFDVIKSSSC